MSSPGGTPRPSSVIAVIVAVTGVLLGGCTRSSTELTAPRATVASSTVQPTTPQTTAVVDEPSDATTSSVAVTTDGGGETSPPIETAAPISVVDIDEIGTPGLDSDDAFCAAWSRFAGSFQVVAVTAAFGSGPPEDLAALEVAASPVVTESYDALFEHWPDELEAEREVVADQFLGPFYRRLAAARDSLASAAPDDATLDAVAAAWVDGLARRDPSTPEFTIDLPESTWTTIDAAAADFAGQRVPFGSDPSLSTGVSTPLTNEYLALSCPDQGTLSGQEVDTP